MKQILLNNPQDEFEPGDYLTIFTESEESLLSQEISNSAGSSFDILPDYLQEDKQPVSTRI